MNHTDIKTNTRFAKSILALSVALAGPAMGQGPSMLEEIVVTAEHREVSLQETQISISAFGTEAIKELGISNGLDLFGHVPNMNVQEYQGGRSGLSFSLRGISNPETLITFDPGVSVYLDNVLLAKNVGGMLDVAELERIEVLRGPQGTLYGRNTMGGAVNYITRKPMNEFEGSIRATVGNYDRKDLRGMLNIPLMSADSAAGELNMRLAAASINRDGIQDNNFQPAPGQPRAPSELGTIDRTVGMIQLEWRPTDELSVLYAYDRTRIDEIPTVAWTTVVNPESFTGSLIEPFVVANESKYPEEGNFDAPSNRADTSVDGHGLTIAWDLSDTMTVQSITGYREMTNRGESGTDGSPNTIFTTDDKQSFESLSQEFRLVGTAMDSQLDYSTGLFYWNDEGDVYNSIRIYGFPGPVDAVGKYQNESWAAYGQATYRLTDKWDLTGGLRYTYEDREMNKASIAGYALGPILYDDYVQLPGVEDTIFPDASKDSDNVSWLVSVGYDWNEDVMTYAKISTGFQSGGFNIRQDNPEQFPKGFDDETLVSYELGMKSQWADRVTVNAAVFFSDYKDKQVNLFNPETLGNEAQNADVEIYGLELEVLAQLTDHWQLGLGYGYLHSEYTKFVDFQGNDLSDGEINYAPENTANAHVAYEYPLAIGIIKARVDWSYRDEVVFTGVVNNSSAFDMFNGRISLDDINGPWDSTMRFSLLGKNLTDEGYWMSGVDVVDSFGFAFNLWGEPRTYGADLEIIF